MQAHEQIAAVFETTGWTVAEFAEKSGIGVDRSQLQRRLTGKTPMKDREIQLLVNCLAEHGFPIEVVIRPTEPSADASAPTQPEPVDETAA